MLVDGVAYTREEWEATSPADYEKDPIDGRWTFQGRAFVGAVRRMPPKGGARPE
jgi:hypothetical protein